MKLLLSFLSAGLILLVGCATDQPFVPISKICSADMEKKDVMAAAEEVLAQMHFAIEKTDIEQGYIMTRPLRGAQFFEFWRSDNVGSLNTAESNLHTIRRIAELNLTEQAGEICTGCKVRTQRLELSLKKVSNSANTYRMFPKSSSGLQRLDLSSKEKGWAELGADEKLATQILTQIEKKLKNIKAGRP